METVIVLVVLAVLGFYLASIYNRLVSLRNQFQNAFSQIEVQLKRRYDLIPNLVETAKGYIKHERETLEAVIAARNRSVSNSIRSSTRLAMCISCVVGQATRIIGSLVSCRSRW